MSLEIRVLGELAAAVDGVPVDLPASRKTRCLLAYLSLRPGRRSRQEMCDLLWDTVDDPRAALRWSLTKLRPILNHDGVGLLGSDRKAIWFEPVDLMSDFAVLRDEVLGELPFARAEKLWLLSDTALLTDCELPEQDNYTVWLRGCRTELAHLRTRIACVAANHADQPLDTRDRWAARWLALAPFNPDAARCAVSARNAFSGRDAAQTLEETIRSSFRQAQLDPPEFGESAVAETRNAQEARSPAVSSLLTNAAPLPSQQIRFVETADKVCIAWGSVGDIKNPPLLKAANWLTHMELDWQAPIWSPLYRELAQSFHFIRYDERGCGLSDWDVADLSFESFVTDLKRVADATGLDRFPLLGISQGAAVCIEFAARYPELVSHLVLFGGYDRGWRHLSDPSQTREREAVMVLTETGWGRANPAYRHMFSQTFMPDATAEELEWFDEFQRQTASAENAVRFLEAFSRIDVRDRLGAIQCPTLVIHSRGDQRIPFDTGRNLAAQIPGARFAGIESNNHLLLGREPASAEFIQLTRDFLAE